MRILFFIVHPAKYHLFRNTFMLLEKEGIDYDIVIANKDILASLLSKAGLPYTDIFPNGRKIKGIPFFLYAAITLIRTLWKLNSINRKKNYDVFITDDVLSFLGKLKGIPSIVFTDNDLVTIPKVRSIFRAADRIIAPASTDLMEFNNKKIPFRGHKALAHLHPRYFSPDKTVLEKYELSRKPLCIIRLSLLNASHDLHGNPGITDADLEDIVQLASGKFEVIINAERTIPDKFLTYVKKVDIMDFTVLLSQSAFFIGDSGTVASEAAVLGIPNVLINNIAKQCGVHRELKFDFGLQEYFDNYADARTTLTAMLENENIRQLYKERAKFFIEQSEDFNEVLVNHILDYRISNK